MFSIKDFPITIRAYEESIIPFIAADLILVQYEKFARKIVRKSIDLIFTPFITIVITLIPMLFVFGPLLSLVEFGISQFILWMKNWLLGIGLVIYCVLYQGIVLTGTHNIINMTINISFLAGEPSMVFAVVGACIGVVIITKNKSFRKSASSTFLPALVGGISEPLLYGVTFAKLRPFVIASILSAVGAWMIYMFNLPVDLPAGGGLFAILGFIGIKKQLLILLCWSVSIGLAAVLTVVLYKEKNNPQKQLKKQLIKQLKK